MENTLYDELLQEIFRRLPSSSSSSVSLVCKRWLHLYRSSTTSLTLRLSPSHSSLLHSFSSFLSHHPFLSSLSLSLSRPSSPLSPHLLSLISSSCPNLLSLTYLPSPLSPPSILSLSSSFPHLTSLSISLSRPILLHWLLSFPSLKHLSILFSSDNNHTPHSNSETEGFDFDSELGLELELETLCFVGIRGDDWGLGWLWKRCKKLKKLKLQDCQGIGASYSSFIDCLQCLQEVELRTCRSVVDVILLELLEHSRSLNSLLVHDGGNSEGLLQFFSQCRCEVTKLDLRLPLDLNNHHLAAVAANFRGLTCVRLQSCCFVSGESLKALAMALSNGLEELALINCDVVEREPGLLATMGQHLRQLKKLDLSHNEMLLDKELVSMLVSCVNLIELRVRGCKGLTGAVLVCVVRSCKRLENVDIMQCFGIEAEAVEIFVKNCSRLRRMEVEGSRVSDAAKIWASNKFIELVV